VASVPTFRSDIEKEIDLIEEVARIYGYNNIPDATTNKGPLFTPSHPREEFFGQIRHLMTGAGFDEIMGHGLADSRHASLLVPDRPQVKITNPVSEDINIMRNTLLVTALTTVSHNFAHRCVDLRLFEIGAAYFPPDAKRDWHEDDKLALAVSGNSSGNWKDHPRASDFHDLKGALDTLFARLGYGASSETPVSYVSTGISFFEHGESFDIRLGSTSVGIAGKATADILKRFDIKQSVWLAELDITALILSKKPLSRFTPLPTYPSAPRDLALVVKESVQVGQIIEAVKSETGPLAETVEVFDIYKGKPIPPGHKSVGITIVYRSAERSLAGDEVEQVQQKVVARLKSQFNAELREQ
jgi:phenylalanyl-tRNA synthetase beta chain